MCVFIQMVRLCKDTKFDTTGEVHAQGNTSYRGVHTVYQASCTREVQHETRQHANENIIGAWILRIRMGGGYIIYL